MEKAQAYEHITNHLGYIGCAKLNIDGREVLFEGKIPVQSVTELKAYVSRSGPEGMPIPRSRLSRDYGSLTEAFKALEHINKQFPDAGVFVSPAVDSLKQ